MRKLSVREMRAVLGKLDELVEREGEVIVTRHGQPLARILPIRGARSIPSRRALREMMSPISTPSEDLVRQDREER